MDLTNFFRKKYFIHFLNFLTIVIILQSINLSSPVKDALVFKELKMNLDTSFSCYLIYVMNLNIMF